VANDPVLERIGATLSQEPVPEPQHHVVYDAAPAPPAALPIDSAVSMLHRMGVPRLESHGLPLLNAYFACVMKHARNTAGRRWPEVLDAGGLQHYLTRDPVDDNERAATAEECSQLIDAFEAVFGAEAPGQVATLGRTVTEDWLRSTQPKPFRVLGRPESKVADALYVFNHSMDRVRGEPLHAWKQIDRRQFWIVHYSNLFTIGRHRQAKACYYWVAAFEAALRWGGTGTDWVVEETECGCVTGAYCCVFTVERAGH
jgi:hypothetical protein